MHDQFEITNGMKASGGGELPDASHPDDVINNSSLTTAQKRALLASWASDARAVINAPALRRLDHGGVVEIDSILAALKQLDKDEEEGSFADLVPPRLRASISRRRDRTSKIWRNFRRFRRDDDDDDPPPCPVAVWPRPVLPLDATAGAQAA